MSFKAVFLDAGGTLLRERAPRARIYAQAARRRGLSVQDDEMAQWMYRAHTELPRTSAGAFRYSERWFGHFIERIFLHYTDLGEEALPGLQAELYARFADPKTFEPVPGAAELLAFLGARGVGIWVVSNWSERLPELLSGLGLAEHLDGVLVSAIEQVEKPDPALFERALSLAKAKLGANLEPASVVHLGDRLDCDVAGARAVGIFPVLYDPAGPVPPAGREREAADDCLRVASLDAFRAWVTNRID